jgi:hypothetical protein
MLMKKVHLCVCLLAGLFLLAGHVSAQEKKFEIKGPGSIARQPAAGRRERFCKERSAVRHGNQQER